MELFEVDKDSESKKCGGCNWHVDHVYLLAENQEQADMAFKESGEEDDDPRGLCGDCMAKMLMEEKYDVTAKPKAAERTATA